MSGLELRVTLNGTSENPWRPYGLLFNPFPQLGKAEYAAAEERIARLDGEPIKDEEDLRARLEGFSVEFVEGCVQRFKPGERISFTIRFSPER